jgi:hypothetical protein
MAATSSVANTARADVTSWLAIGGGGTSQLNRDASSRSGAGALSYSVGVGTSPLSSFVIGGLFRGQTFFGLGTDVGLAVRGATGGFARGDWGLALDLGAAWRPWKGGDYGEWPFQGVLTLGAPWGFQVALGTEISSVSGGVPAQGFFATLEIDLLRLTVMRQAPPSAGGRTRPPPAATRAHRSPPGRPLDQ